MSLPGWSRWVFDIDPGRVAMRTDAEIKHAAADFGRKTFGPTFQVRMSIYVDRSIVLDLRACGHPVLDPRYVEDMTAQWRAWAVEGFGDGTQLRRVLACASEAPPGVVRTEQ